MLHKIPIPFASLCVLTLVASSLAQPGMRLPVGARYQAMGDVGWALADDAHALWYNPAGLGLPGSRFARGCVTYCRQPLDFGMSNASWTAAYQSIRWPRLGWGGYIGYFDQDDLEEILCENGQSTVVDVWHSYATMAAMGAGLCVQSARLLDNSIGCAIKYSRERMYDSQEDYNRRSFALDLGYVLQLFKRVRLGVSLRNIGPATGFTDGDSTYAEQDLPFMVAGGIAYRDSFNYDRIKALAVAAEISVSSLREPYETDGSLTTLHAGVEALVHNTVAARAGLSRSNNSQATYQTLHFGLGAQLFNHIACDFLWLPSRGAFDGQYRTWGMPFTAMNLAKWHRNDLRWWRSF